MKVEENCSYLVKTTEQGYNEGDIFIVHEMDGRRRWIEFDNGMPFWEDPEILESLELEKITKEGDQHETI